MLEQLASAGGITWVDKQGPPEGWTTLMRAVTTNNLALVRAIVKQGADVNAVTRSGITAAMLAARFGLLDSLKYLEGKRAKLTYVSWTGRTVLTEAIRKDHAHIVRYLLEQKVRRPCKRAAMSSVT